MAKKYSFDGVVNNVGMVKLHRLGEIDLGDIDHMLRLNIHPTILTAQAVLPDLLEKRWGRIVNVTSLVTTGTPLRSGYAAAKAAVNSLTRTWAMNSQRPASPSTLLRSVRLKPSCFGETPLPAVRPKFGSSR